MGKTIEIDLKAGTAAFIDGMDRAGKSVENVGHKAGEAHGLLSKFVEGFGIGAGIEVFRAGLEAVEAPLEQLKQAFEDVTAIGRNALKLDVSAEEMSRFTHAANATHTEVGALTTGIGKLSEEIGKVASGDAGAKQAAAALETLRLDAKQLVDLNPAETFKRVSEAVAGLHDPYARAAAVQALMGRGGRELIPVMENLRGLMQESDDIGFTRTAEQLKDAEEEERNLVKLTDTLKGALMDLATSSGAQKLAEEFAHAAQGAKYLLDLATGAGNETLDQLGRKADDMREKLDGPAAAAGDASARLEDTRRQLDAARELQKLDEQIGSKLNAPEAIRQANEVLAADQARVKALEAQLSTIEKQAGAEKAVADAAAEAKRQDEERFMAAEQLLEKIQEEARVAGMTRDQKEIEELRGRGADDFQVKEAEAAQATRRQAEEQKRLAEDAKRIKEETLTPTQKYIEQMEKLNKLHDTALLNDKEYFAAAQKAHEDLEKSKLKGVTGLQASDFDHGKEPKDRKAELLTRSFDFRVPDSGRGGEDPQREIAQGQKTGLAMLQKWDTWIMQIWQSATGTGGFQQQQPGNVLDLA